jgi:hypothetical protein
MKNVLKPAEKSLRLMQIPIKRNRISSRFMIKLTSEDFFLLKKRLSMPKMLRAAVMKKKIPLQVDWRIAKCRGKTVPVIKR